MPRVGFLLSALALPLLAACADSAAPTAPASDQAALAASRAAANTALIKIRDDCDPASFNAVFGPGTCFADGRTTFGAFIAELRATKVAAKWNFAAATWSVPVGATLVAVNKGGEVHTFTDVAAFGGGLVPPLNDLAGTPNIAPECLNLDVDDFVPFGGKYVIETGGTGPGVGTHLFQCCIHPWMRATVTLH